MMPDDARYDIIKMMIVAGKIKSFADIFIYIPKTTVYKDLGINFNRFGRAILDPSIFRLEELMVLAELFDVDGWKMIEMAYEQVLKESKIKSGKPTLLKTKKESH